MYKCDKFKLQVQNLVVKAIIVNVALAFYKTILFCSKELPGHETNFKLRDRDHDVSRSRLRPPKIGLKTYSPGS